MKTITFFILFFWGCQALSSQNLNAYKYVQVPEKYEFQDEENEYLLNAMTAFLFEKQGFKVLYEEEIPAGTNPCEILKANVVNESNLFRTKVLVTLKDCYGNIVFTSEEGKSKFKDYTRSFRDALRNAFTSVEKLNYNYEAPSEEKAVVAFKIKKVEVPEIVENNEKPKNIEKVKPEEITTSGKTDKNEVSVQAKKQVQRRFINGNTEYRLEKTAAGYVLFKADEKEKFATLMKSAAGESYIYSSEKLKGAAYFDETGNLVVEYISHETGQLVSLEYKIQK